jgi:GT2 family glycosyltransferase
VSIRPEDFNHGGARNTGAGEATGDYIVFISQDVIAAGPHCLYDMIRIMEQDDLIAAAQ